MDLTPYVEQLRRHLAQAADVAGEEARPIAERLTSAMDAAVRLTLLDALSAAMEEITRELAPGAVDLRLRGREPEFMVTSPQRSPVDAVPGPPPPPQPPGPPGQPGSAGHPGAPLGEPGPEAEEGTSRITLRLPETLKSRAEAAAAREELSVNAWLIRAIRIALGQVRGSRSDHAVRGAGTRLSGWVH